MNELDGLIRRSCRPLEPAPTGVRPVLPKLKGIRVALFDIYGTLLISASGDIATSHAVAKAEAFQQSLQAVGLTLRGDGEAGVGLLLKEIEADHKRAREAGIDFPEVEIVGTWRGTVERLEAAGMLPPAESGGRPMHAGSSCSESLWRQLAFEYEARVNPVWRMPHARECLRQLHAAGIVLGLISNAQFLTLELWSVLLEPKEHGFEFDEELQYYSYQHGRAKPGLHLFELAAKALERRGVRGHEVLYVGNDMLNDIMPARAIGFQTALFAGDARSLRLREGDPRVDGVTPDAIVTDLADLPACLV